MKNTLKRLGIVAITTFLTIAVLAFTACKDSADSAPAFTVSFNANGGNGAVPDPITVEAGKSVALPGQDNFLRNGYAFGGWDDYGTGYNYQSGDYFTPTGNITLYAKWDAISYAVTFNANGGIGTGPNPISVNAGSGITLPSEGSLVRSGYAFGGWNINMSGTEITYQSGDSFTPIANTIMPKLGWKMLTKYDIRI